MRLNVAYYKNSYFHFQKFIELDPHDSCAICDFNKKEFKDQIERYLNFLTSQRVNISLEEKDGLYKPKISFRSVVDELRFYDSKQSAYRYAIKKSFEILNNYI